MKLKKLIIITILLAIVSVSLKTTVFADETESYDTDVDISFLPGTAIVPPVDPDNPGTATGETGTNQPGPLSLDRVPTLQFGTAHMITGTAQNYNTTTSRPYLQISDLRGTGSGWKVTASLSGFTSGQTSTLQGAYITLKNASLNTATTGIEAPVPTVPVTLTSDGTPANVTSASDTTMAGRGTWLVRWYPADGASDVQLTVPAGVAVVGSHTATLTWTLYDAP